MKKIDIYTDGACSGNPGPGGYGTILKYKDTEKILSEGYKLTTNNRMEILSVIVGLEILTTPCEVTLYTDSRYVVDSISLGWAKKWKQNNWMRNKKEKALNADLWDRMLHLLDIHKVNVVWVKGHAGHEYNERCDKLAVAASKKAELLDDEEYLRQG
ncbi:MAG: ribonuclease HI [Clostridiales bacterium GWE2_32_10]|nr:MAG: ribonuclease HI [Clostridiales bacterium GWE2_32_10]HBY21272.1 ribonuclease HI [Clostridiales bacterium]